MIDILMSLQSKDDLFDNFFTIDKISFTSVLLTNIELELCSLSLKYLLKYWKNLFYPKFLPTSTLTIFTILVNQHIVQVTALKPLF